MMKVSPDKKRLLIVNAIIILIFAIIAIFLWPTFSEMFMPFFLAIILAYLLNPLVRMLEHHGISRGLSVLIVFVIVLFILFVLFMSFVPSLITSITQMVSSIPQMMGELQKYSTQITAMITQYNDSDFSKYVNLQESFTKLAGMFGSVLQSLSNSIIANSGQLMNIVIIPLVTIFLLLDKEVFIHSFMYLVPINARNQVRKMFSDVDMVIGGFIRGQGLMSIIAGILTGVGAYFMGLPYAPIIGVVAGVTTMVPYFGPAVGMVVICVMALLSSPILMVYILIWMCVVQVICGNLLAPAIMSGNVGLHPVVIIFSIFFFGALFGGFGMILAVPMMGAIKVVLKYVVAGFASSKKEIS
ncbi:MAG: AI-2E family transporter [Eubacterium sp.]